MKVLIIEDEYTISKRLEKMLNEISSDIVVLDKLNSLRSVRNYFTKCFQVPDVIFSDIRLNDGLIFDALHDIDIRSHIVFVTAYDEYAIKAFKFNGIDYILKPPTIESLKFALKRAQDLSGEHIEENIRFLDKSQYITRMICNSKGGTSKVVDVNDIAFFNIEYGGVGLKTFDNYRFELDESLDQLASNLDPNLFFRANRQYIININSIESVVNLWNRKLELKLKYPITNQDSILISKEKITQFRNWLSGKK